MIKPFGEYVLIQLLPPDEVTEGGIVLPPNPSRPFNLGKVLDRGSECKFAQINNVVMFPAQAGIKVPHKGKEYLILLDRELWGRIE